MSKAARRERRAAERAAREALAAKWERQRRWRRRVRVTLYVVAPLALLGVVAAGVSVLDEDASRAGPRPRPRSLPAPSPRPLSPAKDYRATIDTSEGTIVLALDAQTAPTSVRNFIYLAQHRFYDGVVVNRSAKDFVMQTGSPTADTSGGPGYTVNAELPQSPYAVGSVAWAKTASEAPGTAGSQFFIGTGSQVTTLPLEYGILGSVESGLDVAVKIADLAPESGDGPPTKRVRVKRVRITKTPRSQVPSEVAPPDAPPTDAPPTDAPPTDAPPTDAPPTDAPPTDAPPTDAPPAPAPSG